MTVCCANCKYLMEDGDKHLCTKDKHSDGGILWLMHDINTEVCTHWEARE